MLMLYPSQRLRSQDVARVSKSMKAIKAYYQRLKLLRKGKLHEEKGGLYFSGKYTCILIIMHYFHP